MVIDFIPRQILVSPFSRHRERFGVSLHCIEKGLTILVRQFKLECNRSKHIIYAGE
jgi:hypothetical protein